VAIELDWHDMVGILWAIAVVDSAAGLYLDRI
jgi:hypothetical protein